MRLNSGQNRWIMAWNEKVINRQIVTQFNSRNDLFNESKYNSFSDLLCHLINNLKHD